MRIQGRSVIITMDPARNWQDPKARGRFEFARQFAYAFVARSGAPFVNLYVVEDHASPFGRKVRVLIEPGY